MVQAIDFILTLPRPLRRARAPLLPPAQGHRQGDGAWDAGSALCGRSSRSLTPLVGLPLTLSSPPLPQERSTLWVLEASHYRAVKQALVQKDLESRVRRAAAPERR